MKKRIKDLTYFEVIEICEKNNCSCFSCPLCSKNDMCAMEEARKGNKELLNKEVDL